MATITKMLGCSYQTYPPNKTLTQFFQAAFCNYIPSQVSSVVVHWSEDLWVKSSILSTTLSIKSWPTTKSIKSWPTTKH